MLILKILFYLKNIDLFLDIVLALCSRVASITLTSASNWPLNLYYCISGHNVFAFCEYDGIPLVLFSMSAYFLDGSERIRRNKGGPLIFI